jgi:hypothetical protein
MTRQQQILKDLKESVYFSFGISNEQIENWNALDTQAKEKIAAYARISPQLIHDYSWVAMDNQVREKILKAASRLYFRDSVRIEKIGNFSRSANA